MTQLSSARLTPRTKCRSRVCNGTYSNAKPKVTAKLQGFQPFTANMTSCTSSSTKTITNPTKRNARKTPTTAFTSLKKSLQLSWSTETTVTILGQVRHAISTKTHQRQSQSTTRPLSLRKIPMPQTRQLMMSGQEVKQIWRKTNQSTATRLDSSKC